MSMQQAQAKDQAGATKDEPKAVQKKDSKKAEAKKNTSSPAKQTRAAKLAAGIPGAAATEDQIAKVARMVPADEPGPLPLNDELKYVGKPIPRVDGPLKATGRARYTADVYLPRMLYGK